MDAAAPPGSTQADRILRDALAALTPFVRVLVANGIAYPQFSQALKRVFLEAARQELRADGARETDSALSLLSGVHRKDVRAISSGKPGPRTNAAFSTAAAVFTRWSTQADWLDSDGHPAVLPLRRRDEGPSFEALAQACSKDVHPRAVLDELIRLGIAELDGEAVRPLTHAFIPLDVERAYFYFANAQDHLAAGASNLRAEAGSTPFLDHAVYADELSRESVEELQRLTRELWAVAFQQAATAATRLCGEDAARPAAERGQRMRFGAYFFAEPMAENHQEDPDKTPEGN